MTDETPAAQELNRTPPAPDGGIVHNLLRWGLVPAALAVAFLCMPGSNLRAVGLLASHYEDGDMERCELPHPTKIKGNDAFILWGDRSRTGKTAQQRAIWERWPDDKVYLHNYLMQMLAGGDDCFPQAKNPDERYAALTAEIDRLRPFDPDNARFDYLLAGRLLNRACEFKSEPIDGKTGTQIFQPFGTPGSAQPFAKPKYKETFIVKDRAKLDQAMKLLRDGLAKPVFHTYTQEMNKRRLAILGAPSSMMELLYGIGVSAEMCFPDIGPQKALAKTAVQYGELLAAEGRAVEAGVYLDAYKTMIRHTNNENFTLIGQLVQGAIADNAAKTVPAAYDLMGLPEKAAIAKAEAEALAAPVREWKVLKKSAKQKDIYNMVEKHGSILSSLMFPAIGESVAVENFTAGRELEFIVAERGALAYSSVFLFFCMMVCLGVTFYHHRSRRGGARPLLLLPGPGDALRILGGGVLLPLLAYYLFTHYFPGSGRDFNLANAWLKLTTELLFLQLAVFWLVTTMVDRMVRRRCLALNVPVPPAPQKKWWLAAEGALFAAFLAVCLFRFPGPTDSAACMATVSWLFTGALLLEIIRWIVSLASGWRLRNQHRLFYGTRARSLIPICALVVILVKVACVPFLRHEEARLAQNDQACGIDPDGGFTLIESRLVKRLQKETRTALEKISRDARDRAAAHPVDNPQR